MDFFCFHAWEHDYFSGHDKEFPKAFLTVRWNETKGLPENVNDVSKQPIFTGVLDNVFVVGSVSFKICENKRYCDLDFGLTKKISQPAGISQTVKLSQDIQDEDEDMEFNPVIFKMDYQGQLGRMDLPINKPNGYLIQSFKYFCEQYHGNSTRT